MTKRHTWSFSPEAFHNDLVSKVIAEGSLRLDLLRKVAKDVAAQCSTPGRTYLDMISLDDSDFLDDQWVHKDKLYAASMADGLVPAPGGDYILNIKPALLFAEWHNADIQSVIVGDQLATLVDSSGSPALKEAIGPYVADYRYGGWLSAERAGMLLARLEALANLFKEPPSQLFERYSLDLDAQTVRSILAEAYEEATSVMYVAVARREAIRIVDKF